VPDEASSDVITVTVKILVHDPETCGNSLTYKNDPDKYYSLLPGESYEVQLNADDATAAEALLSTLIANDIEYEQRSNGYFPMIGGFAEADHGQNSGWLFMVDDKPSTVTADAFRLVKDSTMVWFYTDDYTNDYGSEEWNTEPAGDTQPVDEPAPVEVTFTDVPEDH
jgi:hypothetical protein